MRDRKAQARARKLRNEMTKAETVPWTILKGRALGGWKFRRQHPIGSYIADFACLEAELIVEVDGATHAEACEIERDAARTAFLEQKGFTLLRVANLDIYENLDGVARLITATLAPLGPSGHSPRERGETPRRRLATPSPARQGGGPDVIRDGGGVVSLTSQTLGRKT